MHLNCHRLSLSIDLCPWHSLTSPTFHPSPHDQMATGGSVIVGFTDLFVVVVLHVGCFFIISGASKPQRHDDVGAPSRNKKRKVSPSSHPPPLRRSASDSKYFPAFRSYLGRVFSFRQPSVQDQDQDRRPTADASIHPSDICMSSSPLENPASITAIGPNAPEGNHDPVASVVGPSTTSFASRKDIYPCHACGEILSKPHLLELHQATKHSLSELSGGETSYNIVQIIFKAGWKGKAPPVVHRVLKIHNAPRTLARFEEYRDTVRSKAARHAATRGGGGALHERCIADGNERLRFYCSTSICSSRKREAGGAIPRDAAAGGGVCGSQYCSACAIVRHGFSGKQAELDGITTFATSWAAHSSVPEDLEREFAFMRVRRAMLVCRVMAGRISYSADHSDVADQRPEQEIKGAADQEEEEEEEKAGRWWDSVAPTGGVRIRSCRIGQIIRGGGEEVAEQQLVVFSQRAVLPCFLIIYSTTTTTTT